MMGVPLTEEEVKALGPRRRGRPPRAAAAATVQPIAVQAPGAPDAGDVHQPEWLRRLGEPGGLCWTVRSLDSGQEWGPYYEPIEQADIDELDAGRHHRYEVSQWRDSPTGKARIRQGRPRLVRVREPLPPPPPSPHPGDTTGQLAYNVAQALGRLETLFTQGQHRDVQRGAPMNPWTTPTGEAAVPASTLATLESNAERRIRSAEESAAQRIASVERTARTELDAQKALHETIVASMKRTVEDLEARSRRAESELDRLRSSLDRLGDERDDLDRALQRAEDDARQASNELLDMRRRAEAAEARAAGVPSMGMPGAMMPGAAAGMDVADADIDKFIGMKRKLGKLAAEMGWVPSAGTGEDAEPLETRKLKGYVAMAEAGKGLLVDLIGAWQDRKPAAPPPMQPQRPGVLPPGRPQVAPTQTASGPPDGARQLVGFLETAFQSGQSAPTTLARVAPMVPDDILAIFRAMPTPVFVQNVWTTAAEGSPLRTMQARIWLSNLHNALIGPQAPMDPGPPPYNPITPTPPPSDSHAPAAEPVPSPGPSRGSWLDGAERLTHRGEHDAGEAEAQSA